MSAVTHSSPAAGTIGTVVQVLGAVVDIEFPAEQLPGIYNAVQVSIDGQAKPLTLEVEQQLGNNWVRCVAMGPTDGMRRGDKAVDMGEPMSMPVGPETLGRIFNVVGEPIDNLPAPTNAPRLPIHRMPPSLEEQASSIEVLSTGVKVIDLIAPFMRGGKVGTFGGAGTGRPSSFRN